jgi:mRNA interferase YafQ
MLQIKFTSKMKRDFKRVQKRGYDMSKLDATLRLLVLNQPMPPQYHDHQLKGDMRDFRECHVGGKGDWLLVYRIIENELVLSASGTGTHSDLFDE